MEIENRGGDGRMAERGSVGGEEPDARRAIYLGMEWGGDQGLGR